MGIALCERVALIDPSELHRPEDRPDADTYRKYSETATDPIQQRVRATYRQMHLHQTVAFVEQKHRQWCGFGQARLTVRAALEQLNQLVDESDPDVDVPNIVHAFQTAEEIRAQHPELGWFQLTGLVHDLGKLLALFGEPQWAVVGDTYPVGCRLADSIVYRQSSFDGNPDLADARYASAHGIYTPHCGLDALRMSWGHDEYLYRVLRNHPDCRLPEEALYAIRYHSFYPYHRSGDYRHLADERDRRLLPWLQRFNRFDLYTKRDQPPALDQLWPYYQALIDQYLPGEIRW